MSYIELPNLPAAPVSLVVADGRLSIQIQARLEEMGIEVIRTQPYPGMYPAVSFHPDIMLHHLGENRIVYAPGTGTELHRTLEKRGFNLVEGQTRLKSEYPGNIAYNAARVGNYVFHNTKYTDPVLKSELFKTGAEFVHVNQGYAKCSIAVIDSKSIITADKGIAAAALRVGLDVLLLEPDDNITLYGLGQGFIGGASGMLGQRLWALAGHLGSLKSASVIAEFLEKKQIGLISLSREEVLDIGSIIPLEEMR